MGTTSRRPASLRTIWLLLFMSQVALLWASGDRETEAPFTPAFGSLPGWVYESTETGNPVLRLQQAPEPETSVLWDPELSQAQLRVDNRVYSFEEILGSDLNARADGLEIRFGATLDAVHPDVSRIHVTTVIENAASRPRSIALRYVLSPRGHAEQPAQAFHVAASLPIPLAGTSDRAQVFSPNDRVVEQETSFVPEENAHILIPLVGEPGSYQSTVPPIVAWEIPESADLAQFSVANRMRLLESPWDFRTGRPRDFAVAPGAPADAAIGIRFAEQTLAPGQSVTFGYLVFVQTQAQSEPDPETDPSADDEATPVPEPAAESEPDAPDEAEDPEPSEPAQQIEPARETENEASASDDPGPDTPVSQVEEQTERAFTELNNELNELRTLQLRETPPTQDELDTIRQTIERLRQELENARRSETQE